MGARPIYVAWFTAVMLVVAAGGYLRWNIVDQAQDALLAGVSGVISVAAEPLRIEQPSSADRVPSVDGLASEAVELERQRLVLATAQRVGVAGFGLLVFLACGWAAYTSKSFKLTLLMGVWGWFVGALVVAMLMRDYYQMLIDLRDALAPDTVRWIGTGVPFGLLFVTGLLASLVWNAILPWLCGWSLGWAAREWKDARVPFGAVQYANVAVPEVESPSEHRCSCGTLNLEGATDCYACGSVLKGTGSAG